MAALGRFLVGGLGPLLDPFPRWFRWLYRVLLVVPGILTTAYGLTLVSLVCRAGSPASDQMSMLEMLAFAFSGSVVLAGGYILAQRRGSPLLGLFPIIVAILLGCGMLLRLSARVGFAAGLVLGGITIGAVLLLPWFRALERWADR